MLLNNSLEAEEIIEEEELSENSADTSADEISTTFEELDHFDFDDDFPASEILHEVELSEVKKQWLHEELALLLKHHNLKLEPEIDPAKIVDKTVTLSREILLANQENLTTFSGKQILILALKKVLYFGCLLDFKLAGNKKANNSRKGQTDEEQIKRNKELMEIQKKALNKHEIFSTILNLVKKSLRFRLLPELFNREDRAEYSARQLNDLAINFLFGLFDDTPQFNENYKLTVFLGLFKSVDQQTLQNHLKAIGIENIDIQKIIEEILDYLETNGPTALRRYLVKAKLNDNSGKGVNWEKEKNKPTKHNFEIIKHGLPFPKVQIPSTEIAKALNNIRVTLAQRGNLTARNEFHLIMNGIVVSTVYRRVNNEKYAHLADDLYMQVTADLIEKISMFDIRISNSASTYFSNWIRQLLSRSIWREKIIVLPYHLTKLSYFLVKYWYLNNEELVKKWLESNGHEDKSLQNFLDGSLSLHSFTSLDKPLTEDPNADNLSAVLEVEAQGNDEIADEINIIRKIELALHELPPFERELLKYKNGFYSDDNWTLKEIGDYLGLSRERIRQLLARCKDRLNGKEIISSEKIIYLITDKEKFDSWCEQKKISAEKKLWLELFLGSRAEVFYRRLEAVEIVKYCEKRGLAVRTSKQIKDFINTMLPDMLAYQETKPSEQQFLESLDLQEAFKKAKSIFKTIKTDQELPPPCPFGARELPLKLTEGPKCEKNQTSFLQQDQKDLIELARLWEINNYPETWAQDVVDWSRELIAGMRGEKGQLLYLLYIKKQSLEKIRQKMKISDTRAKLLKQMAMVDLAVLIKQNMINCPKPN